MIAAPGVAQRCVCGRLGVTVAIPATAVQGEALPYPYA